MSINSSFCVLTLVLIHSLTVISQTYVTTHEFGKTYLVRNAARDYAQNEDSLLTFNEAKDYCISKGAQLAKFESSDEWQWFYENVHKKYGLIYYHYWIGAAPVGSGQTPTHWLDGTKIINYFWQDKPRTSDSDCNSLLIGNHNGEPRFETYPCEYHRVVICQLIPRPSNSITVKVNNHFHPIENTQNCEQVRADYNDLMKTTNQQSLTINQLMTKVSQLEQNQKILKRELVDNHNSCN